MKNKKMLYNICRIYNKAEREFLKLIEKKNNFSIVTPVYNGESYIRDLLESILSNKYDLNKIELIIIDDGSIDSTAEIIKEYLYVFPNIKYIYQQNSGQAEARNKGITIAQNEWITFIDSDDFISDNYFSEVNRAINKTKGNYIISVKWNNFYEENNKIKFSHPLSYRFRYKRYVLKKDLLNPKDQSFFQMSMSSVFLKLSVIKEKKLFVKDIKPQFEDAFFMGEYFLESGNFKIAYLNTATYYYRKRTTKNSTLDCASKLKTRYVDLLKNGQLKLLQKYKKKLGYIPLFLQNEILYDISWNIKEYEKFNIKLNGEEISKREAYLKEIFFNIEFSQVQNAYRYFWSLYQIGINYKYYDNKYDLRYIAYVQYETNLYYKLELISVQNNWEFIIDNKRYVLKDFELKEKKYYMNNKYFVTRWYVQIPKNLINYIYFQKEKVSVKNLLESKVNIKFNPKSKILFFDRINKADDNAEVLYEYFKKYHPNFKNIEFLISKKSKDWNRLKNKGYKVYNYDSRYLRRKYKNTDFIISSSFDRTIENKYKYRYPSQVSKARFVFLQHGITTDDQSEWFNSKRVDKIITSANFEYNNLLTNYMLFKDQVALTGMPRFDKLYNNPKNEILIQFTWRKQYNNLTEDNFIKTDYFKNIINLLKNKKINYLLEKMNYKVLFVPHPNINKYLNKFKFNSKNIEFIDIENVIFRDLFARAKLMITDYSSVMFDFSYLKKPVILYQYDYEEFYSNHLYTPELDYKTEGLGKVVESEEDLIATIEHYFNTNFKIEDKYLKRIDEFYAFVDKNNSKRVFEELKKI